MSSENTSRGNLTKSSIVYEKQQKEFKLLENDHESFCPFTQPFMIPPTVAGGSASLMRLPCSTSCPHASVVFDVNSEQDGKFTMATYEITCSGINRKIPVSCSIEIEPNKIVKPV